MRNILNSEKNINVRVNFLKLQREDIKNKQFKKIEDSIEKNKMSKI